MFAVVSRCIARARATAERRNFGLRSGLSVWPGRRLGQRLVLVPVLGQSQAYGWWLSLGLDSVLVLVFRVG